MPIDPLAILQILGLAAQSAIGQQFPSGFYLGDAILIARHPLMADKFRALDAERPCGVKSRRGKIEEEQLLLVLVPINDGLTAINSIIH